jgi:SAM-dependent methyltransferase
MTSFDPRGYWDARHTKRYGPESVGYAGLGVPYNVWMYRVRAHVVAREMRSARINLKACDVLDIGSGTGFYLALWDKLGARSVTGADFAPFAVRSLAEKFPAHRIVELDVTSTTLAADLGTFDLVSAFDIFYHIIEDDRYAQAFRNVKACLRPKGYFVFSENFMPGQRETGVHQVSRSRAEIAQVLSDNGFEVIRRAPVFFLMNRPLKSTSRFLAWTWRQIERVTAKRERPFLGHLLGAALYPIELFCLRFMSTGPTTEMMICRLRE